MTTCRPPQAEPETWALFRLIAAVFNRAIKDAKRGDRNSAAWLDETFPRWREVGSAGGDGI